MKISQYVTLRGREVIEPIGPVIAPKWIMPYIRVGKIKIKPAVVQASSQVSSKQKAKNINVICKKT
jgi:hypothetical protein